MGNQAVYGNIPNALDQSGISIPEEYVEYNLEDPITEVTKSRPASNPSRPKEKSTQDLYHEDKYCLAGGSKVNTYPTSNENQIRHEISSSSAPVPFLTKNNVSVVIVCLTIGMVSVSAVCIYQGVIKQGNIIND